MTRTYFIEKRYRENTARWSILTSFETDDEEKAVQYFLKTLKYIEKAQPGKFSLSLRRFVALKRLNIGEGLTHLDIDTLFFGDEEFLKDELARLEEPPLPPKEPSNV